MTSGWESVALGEIVKPVSRAIEVISEQKYRTIGVRWWGGGAYERETIDGMQTAAKTLSLVKTDDLIINKIWVRHGSTAVASSSVDGCVASGEFPTFEFDQTRVLPRWVHWITQTKDFWTKCDLLSRGTSGKNRIKPDLFLTIEIPLPPLEEQRRIVARVEALAARIEEARGLRAQVDTAADAFFISLHNQLSFGNTVPVSSFLELDERKAEVVSGELYPQVGVRGFGKGLFARETLTAQETTYKSFNRLFEGAVVMSQVKGWEGAIGVCDTSLEARFVSPEYRTFRCKEGKAHPLYIAALVSKPWFWERLKNATRGVGARRERTRPEQFLQIMLPMPDIENQIKTLKTLETLNHVTTSHLETASQLDALLPSVLAKAFAGEL